MQKCNEAVICIDLHGNGKGEDCRRRRRHSRPARGGRGRPERAHASPPLLVCDHSGTRTTRRRCPM